MSAAQALVRKRILVVDDEALNIRLLGELLSAEGYEVAAARSGEEALSLVDAASPSLILLDVVMPGLSGYEVCQELRRRPETRLLPVILVTGTRPEEERIRGLDAGADEFLTKPVNREELLARVRSLLRVQALHREIEEWNRTLESRVAEQVRQLERVNQLKRFLPQRVADLVMADGGADLLEPRRRHVVVCAIDLRGFTAFTETAEPEEIMLVLQQYYGSMGKVVEQHGGTVERFAGDGMVIFFNAPMEIPDAEDAAVEAALAMQDAFEALRREWSGLGFTLGFGVGLASGYATIGAVGFAGHWQYSAIGTVTNVAARLCAEAADRQILASGKVVNRLRQQFAVHAIGERSIRGLHKPVALFLIEGGARRPAPRNEGADGPPAPGVRESDPAR